MKKEETISQYNAQNNGSNGAFAMMDTIFKDAQYGLSKREYFAGLAMQAVISNGKYSEIEIAICAVNFADALLFELER